MKVVILFAVILKFNVFVILPVTSEYYFLQEEALAFKQI